MPASTQPSAASFQPPPGAWLTVALLWVTAGLSYLDRLMVTTMRGSLNAAIPMTEAQFGLLTAVFLTVYAICSPFAGYFADRFNRSRVIIGSLFLWSLVTGLTACARTYEQLLITRALMGVTQAACMPASVALIVEYHRGATRSLASGLLLSGAMSGGALAGLGGSLAESHDWAYAFQLFGLVGVGFSGLLLALLRDPPATEGAPSTKDAVPTLRIGEAFTHLLTNRGYLVMLVYACVLGVVSWSVVGWMPTYIKEHFNLSQGAAGLSATIYLNVAALVGMLVGGAWADRWSRTNEQARILVPVVGLCLAAPAVLLIANTGTLALALGGLVVYGMARNFADANQMPILCLVVDARYRAMSWGLSTFFSCLVGAAGIYVGGLLRDAQIDVSRVFQFASANLLVCAGLLFALRRRKAARAA
ncbi:MFS transporter [Opitutus sp. GAS368]|uniref:MFS transporter n=1 Tax=Opitutus sp. GAS368 TaxID=1882749 RepID=UPI00087B7D65|nr:MFS transporter [Opitutus sp. GAS368]SDS48986.1 Sugar phosphate permease [Opitutus sp. GAS368]